MADVKRAQSKRKRRKDALTEDALLIVMQGHVAFQLLWAGHTLGLFSLLSREPGLTLASIKKRLALAQRPIKILLIGLTALRIIRKVGGGYTNARLTDKWLVPERPRSFAPVLGWQAEIVYPGLLDFVESLKINKNVGLRRFQGHGNTLYQRLAVQPKLERVFQDAMTALSNQANVELVRALPLKGSRHLVDVGGATQQPQSPLRANFPKCVLPFSILPLCVKVQNSTLNGPD
jgi:hypothetical protein